MMATYSLGEFARLAGVSTSTLQRWDRDGILVADRTPTDRRQYTDKHLAQVRGGVFRRPQRRVVVYCRVSSAAQKADLVNQRRVLEAFCAGRGLAVDEWVEEVGGGLNFKRRRFLTVIDGIVTGEIGTLVVAHKDRLVRIGFGLVEHLCELMDCELVVMNSETLSPEREMVEDLMTIVHCFSSRLYGLRNYRKALKKALGDDNQSA